LSQAASGTTVLRDDLAIRASSDLEIVLGLKVDPELWRRPKKPPETQCHICRYGCIAATDQVDSPLRNAYILGARDSELSPSA
jgi:hypothetical protein